MSLSDVAVSKMSASYETSSKSHASNLQNERFVRDFLQKSHVKSPNERFVRDFLQKSHVKSPKRPFRTRLPPKVTRHGSKTSISYETSSKSHASSLQNELTHQSQCHSDIHLYDNSQPRAPRISSNAHKVLRQPRNVTSVSHRDIIRTVCKRLQTVADGYKGLRTRKQRRANTAPPSDSQVQREPFATHSGKRMRKSSKA